MPLALELLAKAPDRVSGTRLAIARISVALTRARRRNVAEKAPIQAAQRGENLGQPEVLTAAQAATTRTAVAVLRILDE